MSFAEDIGVDIYDFYDFYNPLEYVSEKDTTWEDKNGNISNFEDMNISYLQNVYNLLKRNKLPIPFKLIKEIKRKKEII